MVVMAGDRDTMARRCGSTAKSLLRRARRNTPLLASLLAFLITGVAANITFKLEINAMPNMPVFVALLNPMAFTLVFLPLFVAYLWRERYAPRAIRDDARHGSVHGRGSYRGPRGHSVLHRGGRPGSSTPSRAASGGQASAPLLAAPVHGPPPPIPEAAHPWCRRVYLHILGISTLDVIANVIEIVSADGLGSHAGAVSMVLAQGVLPISVVLSLIVLGTRFSWGQLGSAAAVMAGVVIALIPGLTSSSGAFGGTHLVYELLYVVMAVPRASNKVWKEVLLSKRRHRSQRAAVPELAFLEVAFEIPMTLLVAMAYLPIARSIPASGFSTWLRQGFECVGGMPADQCSGAVWTVPAFNVCAIAWRLSTLMVIKHGSATLAFMANAVLLPISDMFFDDPAIVGEAAASRVSAYQVAGLVVVSIALLVYGATSPRVSHKRSGHHARRGSRHKRWKYRVRRGGGGARQPRRVGRVNTGGRGAGRGTEGRLLHEDSDGSLGYDAGASDSGVSVGGSSVGRGDSDSDTARAKPDACVNGAGDAHGSSRDAPQAGGGDGDGRSTSVGYGYGAEAVRV